MKIRSISLSLSSALFCWTTLSHAEIPSHYVRVSTEDLSVNGAPGSVQAVYVDPEPLNVGPLEQPAVRLWIEVLTADARHYAISRVVGSGQEFFQFTPLIQTGDFDSATLTTRLMEHIWEPGIPSSAFWDPTNPGPYPVEIAFGPSPQAGMLIVKANIWIDQRDDSGLPLKQHIEMPR